MSMKNASPMPVMQDTNKGKSHLSSLSNLKVKTKQDVQALMNEYGQAMQWYYPNGFALYDNWRPIQDGIFAFTNAPEPHSKSIVTMFQKMKQFAQMNNLPELSEAVTKSAYWYWKNVETKDPSSVTAPVSSYGIGSDEATKLDKMEKRAKYIQWGMLGGSLILGGTLLYYAFFSKKEEPKPNPRRKRSNPKTKTISRNRVRSRRRNNSTTAIVKRNKPAISSGSSLAEYRKRFDAEKKRKSSRKTVTRKNSKGRLRLKKR